MEEEHMNSVKSFFHKITVLILGRHFEDGFYKKPEKWEKETYILESVFPDEDTMEEALKTIQSKKASD